MDHPEDGRTWCDQDRTGYDETDGCQAGCKESRKEDGTLSGNRTCGGEAVGQRYDPGGDGSRNMEEALVMAKELDMNMIPYEEAEGVAYSKEVFASIKGKKSLGIFIGPEGGFAGEEVETAVAMGAKMVTLGHRILRTETAGMAVMSIIMFELEEDR